MANDFKIPSGIDENGLFIEQLVSPEEKLRGIKKVTAAMMRDSLKTWNEIWEEFQDNVVTRNGFVREEACRGFQPSCGWPEFLEKLWLLRHQLEFTERLSEKNE